MSGDSQEELLRLRRAVGFARKTAHDLAQPVTVISARAQLLLNRMEPGDPNRRAVEVICQEANRLVSLMEQFQSLKEMTAPAGPAPED